MKCKNCGNETVKICSRPDEVYVCEHCHTKYIWAYGLVETDESEYVPTSK